MLLANNLTRFFRLFRSVDDEGQRAILASLHTRLGDWEAVYTYLRDIYSAIFQKIGQLLTFNAIMTAIAALNIGEASNPKLGPVALIALSGCLVSSFISLYAMFLRFDWPLSNYVDPQNDTRFLLKWLCRYGWLLNVALLITFVSVGIFLLSSLLCFLVR